MLSTQHVFVLCVLCFMAKRYHDKVLKLPIINVVPNGTFYRWLKQKGKLGGQHKVPRLSNNRDYIDDILKFTNV